MILRFLREQRLRIAYAAWKRRAFSDPRPLIERKHWTQSLADPTGFYYEAFAQFHTRLPQAFREHRDYFHNVPGNRRGYGEDAFHTLWYLLLEEFRPTNFLEIGVFRGQVISLVTLWAKLRGVACDVHGISPFSSAGDSVTTYREDVNYHTDTLANFDHFALSPPTLVKAYSTDPEARSHISSRLWDMIYIDGNHDYEVVSQDWQLCSANVRPGGVLVLDDSGLTTSFVAPLIASRGHPGPSRVATEIDPANFREILQVGHNRAFVKCT